MTIYEQLEQLKIEIDLQKRYNGVLKISGRGRNEIFSIF